MDEIAKVPYLEEIVVVLTNATQDEFKHSLDYFSRLPHHHRILWNDGPRLSAIDKNSGVLDLHLPKGKGRNVWYCYGYILASGRSEA